jgi:electron transfer flavoprotein alpha subunit
MDKPILVVAERQDGGVRRVSLELLGAARRLTAGKVIAAVVGESDDLARSLAEAGADAVVFLEPEDGYETRAHAEVVASVAREEGVSAVLVPATSLGKDLAALVAGLLDTAVASEVTGIEAADGRLSVLRPLYAGKVIARVEAVGEGPHVITARPNAFALEPPDAGRKAEVTMRKLSAPRPRVRLKEIVKKEAGELDVAEADIVVSGGRGMKGPENFAMLEELAGLLSAAVGASRAAVDAGWQPHARQVGQTGKTVTPKLYIACGISGSIQHLAGMRTSRTIVAINNDPQAPIFKHADYGIVSDLFKVVPALVAALKGAD